MVRAKTQDSRTESLSTLFIEPRSRVDAQHADVKRFATASKDDLRDRWATDKGQRLFRDLCESNFSRDVLESVVGRLYENYDLRGITLRGRDLSRADLHNIDFFASDLREAKFFGCNLTNTHFSEANIKGADFSFARMNDALLDNAIYDLRTIFTGVDIRYVNFNLAALLQDQARDQQRIAHLKARQPVLAFILRWSCNYGQSLGLWMLWVVGTIVAFAVLFSAFGGMVDGQGFFDALYFSVVTFSTLGFGDITLLSDIGKLLVVIEVVLGYVMGGLLIAIFVRRLIGN